MINKVRVRFAPSPTGPLHIGGVRTALYNYLFAKQHNGSFILRIEDTDQKRYVDGAEAYIIEALEWLNIPFDEGPGKENETTVGPYRQSERNHLYKKHIQQLLDSGHAYYAFDTAEALGAHRKSHEAQGKTFSYGAHNRLHLDNSLSLSQEALDARLAEQEPYVIRFKSPENEQLHMQDLIRGAIDVNTAVLDDKVLFKSDGLPTYHLANIVDDHLMEISHVIRGEEWLPSLPLHLLLYKAFGWEAPQFAHLPLILKPEGKGKLSKRDGDKMGFPVFPLTWNHHGEHSVGYREEGYFNSAVINMLALLGWNEGEGSEQELYSLPELIEAFRLEKVSKSGAKFNPDKTKWFNQQYLQQMEVAQLAKLFSLHLKALQADPSRAKIFSEKAKHLDNPVYIEQVIGLIKERAVFVKDLVPLSNYFFMAPEQYDPKAVKKVWKDDTATLMKGLLALMEQVADFTPDALTLEIKKWIELNGYGFGKIMQPLRLSLVGAMQGPHVFDIMHLLGKEETIGRLQTAISQLN